MQSVIGLVMAHRSPTGGQLIRTRSCFMESRRSFSSVFYVTVVIILSGLRSLLKGMSQVITHEAAGGQFFE